MSKKKKQKQRFSKIIVTLVVIMNIIFTGTTFYVFLKTGNEPCLSYNSVVRIHHGRTMDVR